MTSPSLPICFYAYPLNPPGTAEIIEEAIKQINNSKVVKVRSWREMFVTGKLVLNEICSEIDASDIFACDLTILNANVLFELGYATAKDKRIWITLDTSFPSAKTNYQKLLLLSGLGFARYTNSHELSGRFLREHPYRSDSYLTVYKKTIEPILMSGSAEPALLYLKCEVNTEASLRITNVLRGSRLPVMTDDPNEIVNQTLTWYVQNTFHSHAVIAHLLDDTRAATSKQLQDMKYAFVCGMAFGFGKKLLMLAHDPYDTPFDYLDLLKVHDTASKAILYTENWLPKVERDYHVERQRYRSRQADVKAATALLRIHLGDYMAENEHELFEYFVPTAPYYEALQTMRTIIFVGRKGSGKTANLLNIADVLEKDLRNHVSVIRPVDYDLAGIVNVLDANINKSEQGHLFTSLWKLLIYTELAKGVYEKFYSRPLYAQNAPTAEETKFLAYVDKHKDLILSDFTSRMEQAISSLRTVNKIDTIAQQRLLVSEKLHEGVLLGLRGLLGPVLAKKHRVCVLMDNLDRVWNPQQNLNVLSQFLFALLDAVRLISTEFEKTGPWRVRIPLSLMVFLRSDIFAYIVQRAHEADKLVPDRLDWNDPILLQRIIEERFINSLDSDNPSSQIWGDFFIPSIGGLPTKDYIVTRIIPRPRDMIYLCKEALANAVNRRHDQIDAGDIKRAEKQYSQYALDSFLAETVVEPDNFENIVYEFVGAPTVLARSEVVARLVTAGVPDERINRTIDLLVDLTFLGIETAPGEFNFTYDEDKRKILHVQAAKVVEKVREQRYMINIPFQAYLETSSQQEYTIKTILDNLDD